MRLIGSLIIGYIFVANAFISQRVSIKHKPPVYSQLTLDDESLNYHCRWCRINDFVFTDYYATQRTMFNR